MGIADTIKGWFGSGKNTTTAHSDDLVGHAMKNTDLNTDKIDSQTGKMDDGIDTAARKMDDMTGGKAGDMIDKGSDAAKDTINKMGKQNP